MSFSRCAGEGVADGQTQYGNTILLASRINESQKYLAKLGMGSLCEGLGREEGQYYREQKEIRRRNKRNEKGNRERRMNR